MPHVRYLGPHARVVIDGTTLERGGPAVEVGDEQLVRLDDGRRRLELIHEEQPAPPGAGARSRRRGREEGAE